jgi:hypothetical protein
MTGCAAPNNKKANEKNVQHNRYTFHKNGCWFKGLFIDTK